MIDETMMPSLCGWAGQQGAHLVADIFRDTTDEHDHRLDPFDTDADHEVHDEVIAVLTGAIAKRCETCIHLQTSVVAASTPALVRLLELLGRGYTHNPGLSLRQLAESNDQLQRIVDLAEADLDRRTAMLDDAGPEGRTSIADTTARLLVGIWIPRKMRADAPAHAAAEAQRVTDRYGLTGPPDYGADPAWAWAVLHAATRNEDDSDVFFLRTRYTFYLAATADPADEDYLLGPFEFDHYHERNEAALVLRVEGWAPVWGTDSWEEVDPKTLQQGNYTWYDGRPATDSDQRWIMRVRRPGLDRPESGPVPYTEALSWKLRCDCDYPYADSEVYGPPPGHVRRAVFNLVETGAVGLEHTEDPTERERRRATSEAYARKTIMEFRTWLRGQILEHGWPRTGADRHLTARMVLNWVITDPDQQARAQCREQLAEAVAAGYGDPDHLAFLDSEPLGLMPPGLVHRPHAGCRSAFPELIILSGGV